MYRYTGRFNNLVARMRRVYKVFRLDYDREDAHKVVGYGFVFSTISEC